MEALFAKLKMQLGHSNWNTFLKNLIFCFHFNIVFQSSQFMWLIHVLLHCEEAMANSSGVATSWTISAGPAINN